MKYIVLRNDEKEEEMLFPLPRTSMFSHKDFAQHMQFMRMGKPSGGWSRKLSDWKVVSAGFISSDGRCYGRSESLKIDSRPEIDTALLKDQYI